VKLVLDQGVPRRATIVLREAGIEAVHASEFGLSSAADVEIIAWCREKGAVVVTLDADFHAHIALSGETAPSAIRLRTQGQKGPEVGRLLIEIVRARTEIRRICSTSWRDRPWRTCAATSRMTRRS